MSEKGGAGEKERKRERENEREREREKERESVCVREIEEERERESVCVCEIGAREINRGKERERGGEKHMYMKILLSCTTPYRSAMT